MNRVYLLLFSWLWLLDTVFTTLFVSELGLEAEANPLIRNVIEFWGFGGFWLLKALILSGWILLNSLYKDKYNKELPSFINICLTLIMIPVVIAGGLMAFGV
jgi:Domain of unknown function (DUF5658)